MNLFVFSSRETRVTLELVQSPLRVCTLTQDALNWHYRGYQQRHVQTFRRHLGRLGTCLGGTCLVLPSFHVVSDLSLLHLVTNSL